MSAPSLPVDESLKFLQRYLPPPRARVLDVGCGAGDLALALRDRGYQITALDRSPDAVRAARAQGLQAVEGDFLLYDDTPFDAILMSRVLHHISPLEEAMVRTSRLLGPQGVLLIDDFGVDRVDRAAARWLYDQSTLLVAGGLMEPREWDCPQVADPMERWRVEHDFDPPLHSATAMIAGIKAQFEVTSITDAPYLYRHLAERLQPHETSAAVFACLKEAERRMVAEKVIRPIGLRIVARRRPVSPERDESIWPVI